MIASILVLNPERTENAHVKYDCLQDSYVIRHATKGTCLVRLHQLSHSIGRAQKTHMSRKTAIKSRSLFSTQR